MAGVPIALVTPDKLDKPHFHSVKQESDGFECRVCSAFAQDLNLLKAVPCVSGPMDPSSKGDDVAKRLEVETAKLKQLRELQKMQLHLDQLMQKNNSGLPYQSPHWQLRQRRQSVGASKRKWYNTFLYIRYARRITHVY